MRDIVFGQAKGLAAQWKAEAKQRRARASIDVSADTLDSCASELEATLAALERDTKPLTVSQYAHAMNVYPGSVRKWIAAGQLPAEKNEAGDWMIPRAARRAIGERAGPMRKTG